MKTMQSFLIFFYILDQCYELCKEDDLGGLLGAISPEIWDDGQPMDKAIFNDWEKTCNPQTISEDNIVKKTYDFLTYYEKDVGYDFSKTKKALILRNDKQLIDNAIKKMKLMYQKYNYDN